MTTVKDGKCLRIKERDEKKSSDNLYCVEWARDMVSPPDGPPANMFGSVGGRSVSIYSITKDDLKSVRLLQSYRDNDEKEDLYTCVFAGRSIVNSNLIPSQNEQEKPKELITESATPNEQTVFHRWPLLHCTGSGGQLFCVAGEKGVIKILDLAQHKYVGFLHGHGDAIYDLKVSPIDENILVSASSDTSFRIWNLQMGACVAICTGFRAHQDKVLSVAWNHDATMIASSSFDTTVKIWRVGRGSPVHQVICRSRRDYQAWQDEQVMRTGPPYEFSIPCFDSEQKLGFHAIDCVQWVGDMILSRNAVDEEIILWRPKLTRLERKDTSHMASTEFEYLRTFKQQQARAWYIRFSTDSHFRVLVCGTALGDVEVFDIRKQSSKRLLDGTHATNEAFRWMSFSPSDRIVIGACDDGCLYVWKIDI